ncbi:MAG: Nif3-like dinuclear metal center hexameric protein [Planctomycetota bacterium]|jgi:dinuclear metal center YbgI/SA1388 family protein|nr:Nif3-like dinuclear metal center hexameric protein [Planctomycetota bacterium]
MALVKDVIAWMERIAPPRLALAGDPIGLAGGDPEQPANKVLVALDATLGVIEKAKSAGVDMIVSHHPRFYRGLKSLAATDASGRRAWELARTGVALYCAHTNFDLAPGGTNDFFAEAAGLLNVAVAIPMINEPLVKLAVFVPATHIEPVREALCAAGAGAIGRYSDCTFRVRGTGTFKGGPDTNPFLGKPGQLEEADEYRIETVIGEYSLQEALAAMRTVHPYEEVAYDVYPVRGSAGVYGPGRIGELERRTTLKELAQSLAAKTRSTSTRIIGDPTARIDRIAVWAGGGVEADALSQLPIQAIALGELDYHDREVFLDRGIGIIELGHDYSEWMALQNLGKRLAALAPGLEVTVMEENCMIARNI